MQPLAIVTISDDLSGRVEITAYDKIYEAVGVTATGFVSGVVSMDTTVQEWEWTGNSFLPITPPSQSS